MFRWSAASRRALAWPWRASPRVRFGPPPRRERPAGYSPSPRSSRVTVPASWRKGTCVIPTVSPRSSDALSQNGFCPGKFFGFCQSYPALGLETRSEASEYRRRWPVKSSVQIAMGSLCCNAHQIDVVCPARGWGVVWLVISLGLWAGGVCYLVLHVGGHLDF